MAQVNRYVVYRVVLMGIALLIAAALVIAVIVAVKHQGETARDHSATELADREAKNESSSQGAGSSTHTSTNSSASTTSSSSSTKTSSPTPAPAASTGQLPDTGLSTSDALLSGLVLGLLTYGMTHYLQSRRHLKSLL